jgi:hypothetical protein
VLRPVQLLRDLDKIAVPLDLGASIHIEPVAAVDSVIEGWYTVDCSLFVGYLDHGVLDDLSLQILSDERVEQD